MIGPFREKSPKRTFKKRYNNYRQYKPYLAEDFNRRCGYSDCPDFWFGGPNNFHIDHFIPWKSDPKRPELKTDYNNLVYACSYINILKSDDLSPYLDPVQEDFNKHFSRDSIGNIIPADDSPTAKYMYKRLKLYLRRYQVIWMLEHIHEKMELLKEAIEKLPQGKKRTALLVAEGELAIEFLNYEQYLRKNQ